MSTIYSINPSINVASHRLRLFAAADSIDAQVVNVCDQRLIAKLLYQRLRVVIRTRFFSSSRPCQSIGIYRSDVLLASKPFSLNDLLILFIFRCLLFLPVIVDISDNHLLKSKSIPGSCRLILFQVIAFLSANIVTCPTVELRNTILRPFRDKVIIIPDVFDQSCASLETPFINFSSQRADKILWFGNAGSLSRNGDLLMSPSLTVFCKLLESILSFQSVSHDRRQPQDLILCCNYSRHVEAQLGPFVSCFRSLSVVEWSIRSIRDCLASAGSVLLTYDLDAFSRSKSPNRMLLAIVSGVPTLVLNPPLSCHEAIAEMSYLGGSPPSYVIFADEQDILCKMQTLSSLSKSACPVQGEWYEALSAFLAESQLSIHRMWADQIRALQATVSQ
jgi:hypothetical protein